MKGEIMEPKDFEFEFPRGDTCPITFTLIDKNKNPVNLKPGDELYLTVKHNFNESNYIFQKKYSNDEIVKEDDKYTVTIESSDTNTLNYGTYVYDICLKSRDYRKTLCIGQFTLTNESTFVGNE
jgi:hypothetical protein